MFELCDVTKIYRAGDIETTALDRINLKIDDGEYVAVTGPSGCGKSTLLNVLGLIDTPSSGRYIFDGQDVSGLGETQLARRRRNRVSFIFQSFNLLDDLTVAENIELALESGDMKGADRKKRVAEVLERLGVSHRAKHRPSQLSGGQQQRVAIARALAARPKLLLADEPTGNLDSVHGNEVMQILHDINNEGTTLVMVTHSSTHAAQASRKVSLLDGRIVGESMVGESRDVAYA